MLIWNKELWLIDHGAALYFHHSWEAHEEQALRPFSAIKDHVMLPFASELAAANKTAHDVLNANLIREIVALIPDEWLLQNQMVKSAKEARQVYSSFLETRLKQSHIFLKEAQHAREAII